MTDFPRSVRRRIVYFSLIMILMANFSLYATPNQVAQADTACTGAASGDGTIASSAIFHNSTQTAYLSSTTITASGSATVTLRVCQNDVQQVQVLVWKTGDPLASPSFTYNASVVSTDSSGPYSMWQATVPGPGSVINQWYQFKVTDGSTVGYYHPASGNTGVGVWSTTLANPSWGIATSANPPVDFVEPSWIKDAVIYQIFPDRFRNGNTSNDPVAGKLIYGPTTCNGGTCAIEKHSNWNDLPTTPGYGKDFFGGDLQGIIDEINAGYFTDLGVNTLYLNPIFTASSNHAYDPNDFYNINPYFGDNTLFDTFVSTAHSHGIRIILDGVFNHVGSDSKYVDGYGLNRWPNDVGACESASSPYRSWIVSGSYGTSTCAGGWGWQGWYGYETIPSLNETDPVKSFVYRDGSAQSPSGLSVLHYWISKGIDGWRFDAAQSNTNAWFTDLRPYVKTTYGNSNILLMGEVTGGCDWGLYQNYVNGQQLDSAMNYCFRDWSVGFANGNAPSSFDGSYNSFKALFPSSALHGFMNLISSHDSPRALNQVGGDLNRLKLLVLLQMTLPGAPSVYYGDEVAVPGGSDPDDRRTYPWADKGGSPNTAMYSHFKKVIGIRNANSALRGGDVQTLKVDDTNHIYSYLRSDSSQKIVVALNNSTTANTTSISVSGSISDGTVMTDALNGGSYTVSGGTITVPVSGQWAVILVAGSSATTTVATTTVATTPTVTTTTPTVTTTTPTVTTTTPTVTTTTPTTTVVTTTPVTTIATSFSEYKTTVTGQNVYLVGSIPALGSWNTSSAIAMSSAKYPNWTGTVNLPASTSFEYKFIIKDSAGNVTWESNSNHSYITPASGSLTLVTTWGLQAQQVATTFNENATTVVGQNIYVVGDIPALGSWNTSNAILLSSATYPVWVGTINIPATTTFQYKYIKKDGSGNVTWESGTNRSFTTGTNGVASLNDIWK
jgi:glycosidase